MWKLLFPNQLRSWQLFIANTVAVTSPIASFSQSEIDKPLCFFAFLLDAAAFARVTPQTIAEEI